MFLSSFLISFFGNPYIMTNPGGEGDKFDARLLNTGVLIFFVTEVLLLIPYQELTDGIYSFSSSCFNTKCPAYFGEGGYQLSKFGVQGLMLLFHFSQGFFLF